jgi:LPPG:FO 2-phospho-L-lactate transferase
MARVVALAGGVGGAKLADGLQAHLGGDLTVIVNTGDDCERHGLLVMPDHDTVLYNLAGIEQADLGWGIEGDTHAVMDELGRYGEPTWFALGDRDLALHVARTARLRAGARLTPVCLELQRSLRIAARILPMADEPVRTEVRTDDGWLEFQEYFVHRRQEPTVHEVRYGGIEASTITPEVSAALGNAEAIVLCPSNPIVSVAPILAVPGLRDAIDAARHRRVPVLAVSPIIGGRALKGPADRMLASMGDEPSALGVARRYVGLADAFALDSVDAELADPIRELGMTPLVTDTIMRDDDGRVRLAGELLAGLGRMTPGATATASAAPGPAR